MGSPGACWTRPRKPAHTFADAKSQRQSPQPRQASKRNKHTPLLKHHRATPHVQPCPLCARVGGLSTLPSPPGRGAGGEVYSTSSAGRSATHRTVSRLTVITFPTKTACIVTSIPPLLETVCEQL